MKADPVARPASTVSSAPVQQRAARAPGRPLPESVREPMERSFGHEFSSIRVHEDGLAEQVGATAFARGDHLHFRPGTFRPWSPEGRRLIGHELAHVRQRREGRVRANGRVAGLPLNDQPHLEQEAERWGDAAAVGETVPGPQAVPGTSQAVPGISQGASQVVPGTSQAVPPIQGFWPFTSAAPAAPHWKDGLIRQRMKGDREFLSNKTTGVTLGPNPGGRQNWPSSMQNKVAPVVGSSGSATQERAALPNPAGSHWGHQIGHQFGGGEKRQNAAAASDAQEDRQTQVEEAMSDLINLHGVSRNDLRIKHTAYLHPGTRAARFMRIKVYRRNAATGEFEKKIDQRTADSVAPFAAHGPGSRAAFRANMLHQLQHGPALAQKRDIAAGVVHPTRNMANTPASRPWWQWW